MTERRRGGLLRANLSVGLGAATSRATGFLALVALGAPVLVNEPRLTTAAAAWLDRAGLTPAPALRSCGADDFSYYSDVVPSLMAFLGVGTGGSGEPGLHHPRFLPPDETVGEVARAMLACYLGACEQVTGG